MEVWRHGPTFRVVLEGELGCKRRVTERGNRRLGGLREQGARRALRVAKSRIGGSSFPPVLLQCHFLLLELWSCGHH